MIRSCCPAKIYLYLIDDVGVFIVCYEQVMLETGWDSNYSSVIRF